MKTRILTAAYITLFLAIIFLARLLPEGYGLYIFDFAIGILAVIAAVEVARVLERAKKYNSIPLAGIFPATLYLGIIIGLVFEFYLPYFLIFVVALYIVFMLLSYILTMILTKTTQKELDKYQIKTSKNHYAITKAVNTGFVMLYPSLLFICITVLNHFANLPMMQGIAINIQNVFSMFFLILAFAVPVITDTMAMVVGSIVKGPKLCPRISPKKTISGAIGGLVGGVLAAFTVFGFFMINNVFSANYANYFSIWFILLIGLIGSIFCQLGDIFASWLKRRARVKDYGTIFPGHGGVMDRMDGIIVSATFVLICVLILFA